MELNERNCRDFFISGFPSAGGSDAGRGREHHVPIPLSADEGGERGKYKSLLSPLDLSLSSHPIYLSIFYLSPLDTR